MSDRFLDYLDAELAEHERLGRAATDRYDSDHHVGMHRGLSHAKHLYLRFLEGDPYDRVHAEGDGDAVGAVEHDPAGE